MSEAARHTRRRLLSSLVLLAALGLTACGGGGSSSTGASSSTTASDSSTSTAAPPAFLSHSEASAKTATERHEAGRAAPFVAPESDNSVPTFGAEAASSQRSQAEVALKAYLQARAHEDWASACRLLAKGVREGYEKLAASSSKNARPSCADVLPALSKGADLSDPLTGHLLSLRVHGINAFALFYGPHHQQYMVPMNREAGQWRPTQASPIAYPPGAPGTTSP
jgi:hypothetical protein